jgi:hypothetical protein
MTTLLPGIALRVLAAVSLAIRISDGKYLVELLDRLRRRVQNGSQTTGNGTPPPEPGES